jgi:hypothetical protein
LQFTPAYWSGFDALPPNYEALFTERPDLRFDQSLPWLRRLAALLAADGGAIKIIALETGGMPAAILPLVKRPARLFDVNADLCAVANFYTAYFGPVVNTELELSGITDALAEAIVALPDGWQVLDLSPLDHDAELFAALSAGLRRRGVVVEPYFRFGNWYEEVAGRTYEQYHGGRPTQVKETVRRKKKKMEKETAAEFRIVTRPEDVDAAMGDYEAIYGKSWKQAEPHLDFIRSVAKDFAAAGWLRLGVLRVNGRPAAAQIWFVFGGTASIFKLAYDPDFTNYSVGSLLTSHLMNHAISEDGVRVIDYLCGDDGYKKDWMSHRRERWGLRAFRLGSVNGMTGAMHSFAGRLVRRFRHRPSPTTAAS